MWATRAAGNVIDQRARGDGDARVQPIPVLREPLLLQRHAHVDQQQIRFCRVDGRDHRFVLGRAGCRIEKSVMLAGCAHCRALLETIRRTRHGFHVAAEPENTAAARGQTPGQVFDPLRRRVTMRHAPGQELCRELHARAIAKSDIGAAEKTADPRPALRQHHKMGIGVHDDHAGAATHRGIDPLEQGIDRHIVHAHAQDFGAFRQSV